MVVGPMADVMNRKVLYVLTVLVGTIPCLLTYWYVVTTMRDLWPSTAPITIPCLLTYWYVRTTWPSLVAVDCPHHQPSPT